MVIVTKSYILDEKHATMTQKIEITNQMFSDILKDIEGGVNITRAIKNTGVDGRKFYASITELQKVELNQAKIIHKKHDGVHQWIHEDLNTFYDY